MKLTFEVDTNDHTDVRKAIELLQFFLPKPQPVPLGELLDQRTPKSMLGKPIGTLKINISCARALAKHKIDFVDQLLTYSPGMLLRLDGFGQKFLDQIVRALAAHNLRLATEKAA